MKGQATVNTSLSAEEKRAVLAQLLEEEAGAANAFPLSFAQERLWFLDQLEPGSPVYNVVQAMRLRGPLNVAALQQALEAIISRHESLRTAFTTVEGRPRQIIHPSADVALRISILDSTKIQNPNANGNIQDSLLEEARRPFDLAQGPVLRATLFRLDEAEHILLLVLHHIVSDGWSMGVLFRELAALYEAYSSGKSFTLPELPIQYADFAVWQREWLQGEVFETQLAYWRGQLGGHLPVLELPTDHPRPAAQTFGGARQSFVLAGDLSRGLTALSQREGVTLFMTLLAAFNVLLYRYTGQADLVVGSPIANRNRAEIEGLIGFFVNTLVLRTDLSGNPTFRELLGRVREVALGAYAHQDLPFAKLVEELQPERDLRHNPLFQVMFILQNAPGPAPELAGLIVDPLEVDNGTAKFDLTLSLVETSGGLRGSFEYNTDLFDAATIARLAGHFRTLLTGVVADPEQHISALPLLAERERRQLLVEWTETGTDYPPDEGIHQLFETQVTRTPSAQAVIFEGEHLTYRELNRRANQLAHYLQRLGVGPGVLVGICMERSLEMVVGLLGVLKAGGAYLPLDPTYPQERLAFMLKDTQAPVLLTQQRLLKALPAHKAHLVRLDADWRAIAQESGENPVSQTMEDEVAYVIYTSGSTGTPKGVLGLHRGAVNRFRWMWATYPFDAGEICCQKTTLNFVDSVWEIFGPLLNGVPTVIIPDEALKDPHRLVRTLAAQRVTRIVLVPSLLRAILEAYDDLQSRLPHLKIWVTSGEALSPDLLQRFRQRMPRSTLINLYGSSEVSADSTCYDTSQGQPLSCVPIGRPIANTQVYILDRHLQPVPVGVPGELHVGGDGLAQGYLNRPRLTAEKFIPNPFASAQDRPFSPKWSTRLYKTGDVARYLPDGNIEFLGRIDHQVKIRGFRVELGEIEAALAEHPALREAVVVARSAESISDEKRLVAYVGPHQGRGPTVSELRDYLKAKLPEYMVPSAFVTLGALPLTPNGKVARRALPAPDTTRPELEKAFVAPRDALELQLTRIWQQVLGLESVGIRDNFFELGGHSLLVVRLFAQIEKDFGQKLPLTTLFQAPTVEHLADVLRRTRGQGGWSAPWSSLVAIQPGGSRRPFFCIPGNLGNVFIDLGDLARHLGPDQPFYGLQDGLQNPTRIEALAAHYVAEIRTVQPEGPYALGGVCSGGIVAFEMAQQLQAQGQQVALLALVEPSPPPGAGLRTYVKLGASILRRVVARFGHHSRNFTQPSAAERGAYARLKAKLVANMWAVARYVPQTYPGRITLLLGNESLAKSPHDRRLNWREFAAGGAEVQVVPGSHDTITRTHDARPQDFHVQVLAEHLRTCMDSVLADN